jgi:transposase
MDSLIITLAQYMPVLDVAKIINEYDTRVWRTIFYYVCKARGWEVYENVKRLGIDETSIKGQKYITVVVDTETGKVIFVGDGKDL